MKIFFSSLLAFFFTFLLQDAIAQKKNDKNYRDGYVIRLTDTIPCRIYAMFLPNEIGGKVTFKYEDGRIISYNPGSVIKGFGFKKGNTMVHYYQLDVPEYWMDGETNTKAYAQVLSSGQLRLYWYAKIKNSTTVAPKVLKPGATIAQSPTQLNNYFIKIVGDDSLYRVGKTEITAVVTFQRSEILPFIQDHPQAIAPVQYEIFHIKELEEIIERYNKWYSRKTK